MYCMVAASIYSTNRSKRVNLNGLTYVAVIVVGMLLMLNMGDLSSEKKMIRLDLVPPISSRFC